MEDYYMGFSFRKSFKIAPGLKLNLSKKGVGFSLGGKHARYSVSSTGRKTKTFRIPGTGITYRTSSSKRKKR